jgi:cyanophycinase
VERASAGLAILGQFSFSSMIDTIHSPQTLANPYGNKVTLSQEFLEIPVLQGVITDTHFVKRDRMGRLLVFLARILQDGWAKRARAIAVEENAAVLIGADGRATVVGFGPAYFLEANAAPAGCKDKMPLTFRNISVHVTVTGSTFDVKNWKGEAGDDYTLSVNAGQVSAAGSSHGVY